MGPRRSDNVAMTFPRNAGAATIFALCILFSFASCSGKSELRGAQREDLFDLAYGPGETQIDLTPGSTGAPPGKLRVAMREGIFHISNGQGGKLLRLSSYGDVLAMFYDPDRAATPFLLAPASEESEDPETASSRYAVERYAVALEDFAPGDLAIDSLQRVYVEDRLPAGARVYDAASKAWCDRVVRRFGSGGLELSYLGQEGRGGTPFPAILGIYAVDGDDIVVVSSSETVVMAHRFSSEGVLRNIVRFPRDALPQSETVLAGRDSGKIRTYPDAVIPSGDAASPRLALKCDYSFETVDAASGSIDSIDFAGSRIFEIDMTTGSILDEIPLADADEAEPALSLLGKIGEAYILVETAPESGNVVTLQRIGADGALQRRFRLDLPAGALSVPDMRLSPEGILSALVEMPEGIKVSYWNLGSPASAAAASSPKER
ncbi:MAG: hypothetical protein ABFC75_03405 [Rectinema sp.]